MHSTIAVMYNISLSFCSWFRLEHSVSRRSFLIQAETGIFECANAMSPDGKRWKSAPLVANTKLRPKLDRILPLQVPSYLPKPRKRSANTYLRTLPPVPPIITQFAFPPGKNRNRCLSSRLSQSVPSSLGAHCHNIADQLARIQSAETITRNTTFSRDPGMKYS